MTTTISASPQTLADSASQLFYRNSLDTHSGVFDRMALPDPTNLQPSLVKRRTRADRRLLSELGRTKNISKRRSSHKAMAKRMFFVLSGRHNMQKLVPPSYEVVLQLDEEPSSIVVQYRLPSFRDGFSDWVRDASLSDSIQSKIALNRMPRRKDNARLQLPSVFAILRRECC